MRINTDTVAFRALATLRRNDQRLTKALARLSTGLRINRGADGAAGLTIVQRMQAQIAGTDQALRNVQDGVSLFQTADAVMGEMHGIVQRMRELAVQAASGTLTWEDRLAIQQEIDQLTEELSRTTNQTEFNRKNLLGGGLTNASLQIGPNAGTTLNVDLAPVDAKSLGLTPGVQGYVIEGDRIDEVSIIEPSSVPSGAYEVKLISSGGAVSTADGNLTLTSVSPKQFRLAIVNSSEPTEYVATLMVSAQCTLEFTTTTARDFNIEFLKSGSPNSETSVTWDEVAQKLTITLGTDDTGAIDATWNDVALAINAVKDTTGIEVGVTGDGSQTASEIGTTPVITRANPVQTTATYDGAQSLLTVVLGRNDRGEVDATWNEVVTAINGIVPPPGIGAATVSGTQQAYEWPPDTQLEIDGISFSLVDMDGKTVATQAVTDDSGSVTFAGIARLTWNPELMNRVLAGEAGWGTNVIGLVTRESQAATVGADGRLTTPATVEKGVLVDTVGHATSAIASLDAAIARLSKERAHVGALQSGLERTINVLQVSRENITSARSRIEDADMAAEATELAKHQILLQSAMAMLAQANVRIQYILGLLKQ